MPAPVVSITQMREWEKAAWASGQTEAEVIRLVGTRLAQEALRMTSPGDAILILAGRGNNGADARAALPHLQQRTSHLLLIEDPAAQLAELQQALATAPALVVDGLFGIGLNRPLSPEWIQVMATINKAACRVLAVDVPSGLNADSGNPEGAAVRASVTLTVGAPKTGLLAPAAASYVGRLVVADSVGLGTCSFQTDAAWTLPSDFRNFPPERAASSHKGSYGHVAIFAGSTGYHGAATLCARGAQRAQPGLVTLFTMSAVYPVAASQLQAVMVSPWHPDAHLKSAWSAIVIGPGLAGPDVPEEFRHMVHRLWRDSHVPVVVDASALDWLKSGPLSTSYMRVVTPHPGEAARMLGITAELVQADRPKAVRDLSNRFGGAWVVLKGHQTLVGQDHGPILVNSSGNPHMAQGGSGDLLAGYIGGLLAQPALRANPAQTIAHAVWQHGASADLLQQSGKNWIIEDLAEILGSAKG